jgi:hypothetical protein
MSSSNEYLLFTTDQKFRRLRRINRIQLVVLIILAVMLAVNAVDRYDKLSVDPKPPVKVVVEKPAAKPVPAPRVR